MDYISNYRFDSGKQQAVICSVLIATVKAQGFGDVGPAVGVTSV